MQGGEGKKREGEGREGKEGRSHTQRNLHRESHHWKQERINEEKEMIIPKKKHKERERNNRLLQENKGKKEKEHNKERKSERNKKNERKRQKEKGESHCSERKSVSPCHSYFVSVTNDSSIQKEKRLLSGIMKKRRRDVCT